MNVVCNRCTAEYEFDDALVSRRGTTVKCTNCGHQFRVRLPAGGAPPKDDRWLVRKAGKHLLTFTNLRDLQLAIERGDLAETDTFSRDGQTFRPLQDVAELESFFERQTQPLVAKNHTLLGVQAPVGMGISTREAAEPVPLASIERISVVPGGRTTQSERTVSVTADASSAPFDSTRLSASKSAAPSSALPAPSSTLAVPSSTLAVPSSTAAVPSPMAGSGAGRGASPGERAGYGVPIADRLTPDMTPPPMRNPALGAGRVARRHRRRGAAEGSAEQRPSAPQVGFGGQIPPLPADEPLRSASPVSASVPPTLGNDRQSASFGSMDMLSPATLPPPPRPSGLRWMLAFVLIGGMGLLAGTVGKDYLSLFVSDDRATSGDARLVSMLDLGDELYLMGDLEGAKSQFDRASALAETHPRVLLGLLRLATARADQEWLKTHLSAEHASPQVLGDILGRSLKRVSEHVDKARALPGEQRIFAPDLVDAQRLSGKLADARQALGSFSARHAEPQVAYILAALDLAESSPDWQLVIRRLKTALGFERGLGRARSALAYALARSGDIEAAKSEVAKLRQSGHPSPIVSDLDFWLTNLATTKSEEKVNESASEEEVAVDNQAVAAEPQPGGGSDSLIERARAARKAGDWRQAGQLYRQVAERRPGNLEALCGLGAVARAQGQIAVAQSHYGAVLRKKPDHAPALAAYADMAWGQGARGEAVRLYRKLVALGSASERAKERIAEHDGRPAVQAQDAPNAEPQVAPTPSSPASEKESPAMGSEQEGSAAEANAIEPKSPTGNAVSPEPVPLVPTDVAPAPASDLL